MYKIIGADGKEYGPVPTEVLRQWITEGRVNAQTRILPEGATEWKPLSEYPEFAAGVPQPPPSLTPLAPEPAAARDQVQGPATGLIVVAILGFVLKLAALGFSIFGTSIMAFQRLPREAWANMVSGTMGVASNIIGLLVTGLILYGALKMKSLQNYGLAMSASVIAMIPCISPCCLLGLPIGIWALVVLSKPEVKGAFH